MNRHRVFSVSSILILGLVLPALPSGAAIKAGAICKKAQQVRVVKGVELKCVKSGKKLVWRKSATAAPVVVPVVEVTPNPSPSPSDTTSPAVKPSTTPTKASDALSFRNVMIYSIKEEELIRRADSGEFFDSDSRPEDSFWAVRRDAFNALKPTSMQPNHPNVNLRFVVRPDFPEKLATFLRKKLAESASLWNSLFDRKIQIDVYLLTEKDEEFVKTNPLLSYVSPILPRLKNRQERPFISGGGWYWNDSRSDLGTIYLATASYLDLNYVNYEWPQVGNHEFFHVVQDYALYGTSPNRIRSRFIEVQPQHFREGAANTIGYLTSFGNLGWSSDAIDWMTWIRFKSNKQWMMINSEEAALRMIQATENYQPDEAFEVSYAIGALMYEWFIAEYGFEGFSRLTRQIGISQDFNDALLKSVGITKDDFYKRTASYVFEQVSRIRAYED